MDRCPRCTMILEAYGHQPPPPIEPYKDYEMIGKGEVVLGYDLYKCDVCGKGWRKRK